MGKMRLFLYGIFGVLTTVLNVAAYWLITRVFGVNVVFATIFSWIVAVLFAYYTNRRYVFRSKVASIFGIIFEALYFFACRLATGVIDVAIMYAFVDILSFEDVTVKAASNVIVIVLNYVASKIFVFKEE